MGGKRNWNGHAALFVHFPRSIFLLGLISRVIFHEYRSFRADWKERVKFSFIYSFLFWKERRNLRKKKTHARRILMGNLSNNKFKTTQFRGSSSIFAIGWKKEKKKEKLVRFVFKYKDHTPFFLNASGEHSRSEIIRLSWKRRMVWRELGDSAKINKGKRREKEEEEEEVKNRSRLISCETCPKS